MLRKAIAMPLLTAGLAVLLPLAPPALGKERLSEPDRAEFDTLLAGYHRSDAPGCAVGVYRHGTLLYSGAFGIADLSSGERLTPGTAINIGSIGKQFTAAAILLLAQDAKLSLDDDIRKYLPELPDYGSPVTIRRLLTHTSGIRDYRGLLNLSGHRNEERVSAAQILTVMARQRGPNFAPGAQYQYSNSGYFLAGLIVERVSGESYAGFARRRIFGPLGMARARFKGDTAGLTSLAVHYAPSGEGKYEPFTEQWDELGTGDLYTTIEDLARWDGNFHSGALGSLALVRALETRGTLTDGRRVNYAFGLEHSSLRGHPVIGHGGNSGGSVSTLKRFPAAKLSIAVLCNSADGPADALSGAIAKRLLPPVATPGTPPGLGAVTGRPFEPLTTWVGSYREHGNSNVLAVNRDGEGIDLAVGGGRFPLRPLGGDVFQVVGPPIDVFVRFEPASGDRPRRLVRMDSDEPPMLAFAPATPTAAELAGLAGNYQCPELGRVVRIRAEAGKLLADIALETGVELTPLDRGAFGTQNLLFTFDEAAGGTSPGFRFDQWRARGMRCERERTPAD